MAVSALAVSAQTTGYVYAYFQGPWPTGGSSGVYLSYSCDGYYFTPINNGQPVFTPPQPPDFPSGENQTRDPSVIYGPDGLFHMVWTSGIETKTIGYSNSPDLVNWSIPKRIELWGSDIIVNNTWAPEIFYDEAEQEYLVVWASDLNYGYHRLYSFTTTDFQTISRPRVFYDNGNTVIDGMIAEDVANDQFLLAIKDELGGAKNIWLATSNSAQGTYTRCDAPIVGPGSSTDGNAAEGPSLLKIGDTWHLYYDAYGAGYLGVVASTDLENWSNRTHEATLPTGHHGTVFEALNSNIGWDIPFHRSDLNQDRTLDASDWAIFHANHLMDLSSIPPEEQAIHGDLNGDGANDFLDFRIFQLDYDHCNGSGSFCQMVTSQVPEPSAIVLCLIGAAVPYVYLWSWLHHPRISC